MLEAPLAIVALCGPTIAQLSLRSFAHGRFTSMFSSLFSSRRGSKGSGRHLSRKSKDRCLVAGQVSSDFHGSSNAAYYEEMHPVKDFQGTEQDVSAPTWSEEMWPPASAKYGSTTAFATNTVGRGSDESAIPLGPVRQNGSYDRHVSHSK
ncbi:putative Integral membrane protein [Seiridium cardinale]